MNAQVIQSVKDWVVKSHLVVTADSTIVCGKDLL